MVQRRQADRVAKVAFITVCAVLIPTITAIASAITELWLAAAIGIGAGLAAATVTYLVVLIWPAIRLVWYWIGEIALLAALLAVYLGLTCLVPWPVALLLLTAGIGTLLGVRTSRWWLRRWVWCMVTRHRLRTCFATFIRANRYGSLPWILLARPTLAGERVWVWLRPGLSLNDLQTEGGLDRLAVGCWAKEVKISRTKRRNSALLRVDITRRNPLADTITSPLAKLVPPAGLIDYDTNPSADQVPIDMAALDLPGVPEPDPTTGNGARPNAASKPTNGKTKPAPTSQRDRTPAAEPAVTVRTGEDLADWV